MLNNGQKLNNFVVKGYFMERPYDAKLAEKSGSERAIQPGEYNIIPKTPGKRYQWYLEECQDAMELPFIQGIMQRIV